MAAKKKEILKLHESILTGASMCHSTGNEKDASGGWNFSFKQNIDMFTYFYRYTFVCRHGVIYGSKLLFLRHVIIQFLNVVIFVLHCPILLTEFKEIKCWQFYLVSRFEMQVFYSTNILYTLWNVMNFRRHLAESEVPSASYSLWHSMYSLRELE